MSQLYQRVLIIFILALGIFIIWPNSPGIHFGGINKDFKTVLGLDLQGGVQALLEADLPAGSPIDPEAMNAAVGIVDNRVNGLGLTEAVVQKAGDNRIVVELPGETDPDRAIETLQKTGLLELVDMSSLSQEQAVSLTGTVVKTDFGLPTQVITETQSVTTTAEISPTFKTVMTGADLKTVNVTTDPNTGKPQVAFELSADGAKKFGEFTRNNVGKVLGIVLDKRVISAPVVNEPILDGRGVISGNYDLETANALAVQLRYGSLPIPLKVVEVRTVGPTLGQDSLRRSLQAGLIGFAIVILFMTLYYRLPGIAAVISVLTYAILAFAIFRFIPVTITLPGVAGFLLSTGSALDANILIFERLKEELRAGKTLRQSVDLGWKRAIPSIRDSNIATLITSAILFWFGNAFGATIVKGFSITLALGVMVSLFTALVITRVIMDIVLLNFKSKDYARWFGI